MAKSQYQIASRTLLFGAVVCLLIAGHSPRGDAARGDAALPQSQQQGNPPPATPANGTEAAPGDVPVPLPAGKKLVLKDGTFQIVREYHREGDRVRYFSAERSQWEEIPAALVDWKATEEAAAAQQAQQKALMAKIKASDEAARRATLDVGTSLEVRPNVFLPDGAGLYVLDGKQVFALQQDATESHTDKMRSLERIVTGIPMIPTEQHVDIPGKHAKMRIHTLDPEFYFRGARGREAHFVLVRAEAKGDKRELMAVSTNMAGEKYYKQQKIDLETWDAARGVYRYTLDQTLKPGEYALVEMTATGPAIYVWDFGVDAPGKNQR